MLTEKKSFSASSGRILVIDDTLENREVLCRRLEKEGHHPLSAESGTQALEFLKKESFDLILCDMVMPGMTGMEFLKTVKSSPLYREIPILMISVLDEIDAVAHAIEEGAEDYLPKPFNPILLKARIGACLEKKAFRDREKKYLERLHQELSAAAQLQKSILPPSLKDQLLHVDPLLKPASEVGGDFYDYFWLTPKTLAFVIGDVSGKGLTGALFMAVSRTLVKALAPLYKDPSRCLEEVNKILCQNNESMMFVTLLYGILNVETGDITYVNAGHFPPLLSRLDGFFALPSLSQPNPALGVVEEATFQSQQAILSSQEKLILYTDGIPEATNLHQEFFGINRLLQTLNSFKEMPNQIILKEIQEKMESFMEEAPPSDDITVLILERQPLSKSKKLSLTLSQGLSEIPSVLDQVRAFLDSKEVSEKKIYHILLILDELLSNIIFYGYESSKPGPIFIRISNINQFITLLISDQGKAFNPLSKEAPLLVNSLEKREVGGLGIHFVKTFSRSMRYRRNKSFNHVWLLLEKAP